MTSYSENDLTQDVGYLLRWTALAFGILAVTEVFGVILDAIRHDWLEFIVDLTLAPAFGYLYHETAARAAKYRSPK